MRGPKPEDLTGRKFGRLSVICEAEQKWGHRHWHCRCDCGRECVAAGTELKRNRTRSCGCVGKKHGECVDVNKSKEYRIWSNMKSRCSNPKATAYGYYGAKGITVCPAWRKSFEQFLSDMGRAPTKSHSIDRIDPTGGYEPSNCRWATPVEQAGNTGSSTSLRIRITQGVRASPRGNCSPPRPRGLGGTGRCCSPN